MKSKSENKNLGRQKLITSFISAPKSMRIPRYFYLDCSTKRKATHRVEEKSTYRVEEKSTRRVEGKEVNQSEEKSEYLPIYTARFSDTRPSNVKFHIEVGGASLLPLTDLVSNRDFSSAGNDEDLRDEDNKSNCDLKNENNNDSKDKNKIEDCKLGDYHTGDGDYENDYNGNDEKTNKKDSLTESKKAILKSHLQKCIRKSNAELAVRTAMEFMDLDPIAFLRRLPIIMIEDCILMLDVAPIIWFLMYASSFSKKSKRRFAFTRENKRWFCGVVYAMAKCPIFDYVVYEANETPSKNEVSCKSDKSEVSCKSDKSEVSCKSNKNKEDSKRGERDEKKTSNDYNYREKKISNDYNYGEKKTSNDYGEEKEGDNRNKNNSKDKMITAEKKEKILPRETSNKDIANNIHCDEIRAALWALKLRKCYGGTEWDMKMISSAIALWYKHYNETKVSEASVNANFVSSEIFPSLFLSSSSFSSSSSSILFSSSLASPSPSPSLGSDLKSTTIKFSPSFTLPSFSSSSLSLQSPPSSSSFSSPSSSPSFSSSSPSSFLFSSSSSSLSSLSPSSPPPLSKLTFPPEETKIIFWSSEVIRILDNGLERETKNNNLPSLFSENPEVWDLSAVDFHCYPKITQLLYSQVPTIDEKMWKKILWYCGSSVTNKHNIGLKRGINKLELEKLRVIYNTHLPLIQKIQKHVLGQIRYKMRTK